MRTLPTIVCTLIAFTALARPASAGFIGWTGSTYATNGTLDGSTVILLTGESELGWNAGNGSDVTVNGILFVGNPDDDSGVDITVTGDAATGSQNAGEFIGTFATLMANIEFNNAVSGNRSWTMRLEGLNVGTIYGVQFLAHQVTTTAAARDMQIYFGSDDSGPGTGDFNAGEVPGNDTVGHSWTALFTADAATQDFFIGGADGEVPIINAVSVFSIPTPSAAIGGLALLGLMTVRRRRI